MRQTDGTWCAQLRIWSSLLRNKDGLRELCTCLEPNSSMSNMSCLGPRGSTLSVEATVCGSRFLRSSLLPLLWPGDINNGSMRQVLGLDSLGTWLTRL